MALITLTLLPRLAQAITVSSPTWPEALFISVYAGGGRVINSHCLMYAGLKYTLSLYLSFSLSPSVSPMPSIFFSISISRFAMSFLKAQSVIGAGWGVCVGVLVCVSPSHPWRPPEGSGGDEGIGRGGQGLLAASCCILSGGREMTPRPV